MKAKAVTRESLEALIKSIDDELAAINAKLGERPSWNSHAELQAYERGERAEIDKLLDRMHALMGANFSKASFDGRSMMLAGIRSTSTSAWRQVLRNWQVAARKRVALMEAEQ